LPGFGVVESDDVLEGVAQAEPWESFAIEEPRLVELGPDTAALAHVGSGRRGGDVPYRAAIISVYVRAREADAWLLAPHQQTTIGSK
jgi:hypothetical protein